MELIDEYNHNIPNVMYFPRNLPSKEVESLYEQCLQGCNCELECTQDSPTYECNDYCSCHEQICGNKLVQFGPRKNLKVEFCNDEKGLGLFTSKEIKKGNFVCEYAGENVLRLSHDLLHFP
ncbi:hypothetical protein NQ315_005372 [Exocentrus adspersus]|uniref:AWS domain-containing protein n=1 Tax=Exocentrus adspersus TaxID=1586481 RepID=A0AAV8W1Y1_9CUCU|nr:hypothetical protein NQ315_005372 [Exocentrus adspersus]